MPNNLFKLYIQKIGRFLAKYPFALITCLFFLLIVYAAFLGYYYVLNPRQIKEEYVIQNKIDEKGYEEIIRILNKKAANLANPPVHEYRDIFK